MENLVIKASSFTPEIKCDYKNNKIEIKGESYPENTADFYTPLFNWVNEYLSQLKGQQVIVNIDLYYFNSSSSKMMLDFFDLFDQASLKGKRIDINWFYEQDNEDNLEYGREYQEDLEHLTFNFIIKDGANE